VVTPTICTARLPLGKHSHLPLSKKKQGGRRNSSLL
jgi:hypothetical protein